MDLNTVKKALYKEKPVANFVDENEGFFFYNTRLESGTQVIFRVNKDELGETRLELKEPAQHLIRWIYNDN